MKMFCKAAKALGATDFEISQIRHYADALRHGAFELGAPTDHVELITGQKPESFENIVRHYLAEPSLIHPALTSGGKLDAMALLVRIILTRVPDYDRWEQDRGHPMLTAPLRATDNNEWRTSAGRQQLNLLTVAGQ